jgi:hypothetical protein
MQAEIDFSGDMVQWNTPQAFAEVREPTKTDERAMTVADSQEEEPQAADSPPASEPKEEASVLNQAGEPRAAESRQIPESEGEASTFSFSQIPPKTLLVAGLGVGAATAATVALLRPEEEESVDWTIEIEVDDDIQVEIFKTPQIQTSCGTLVSNELYVINERREPFTVTSIDYEVVLTRDKPSGSCAPGRIGTFAPNWAVVVPAGERALVRQWSNVVNPCSGCPYTSSECKWASKYIVHTSVGSGEAETTFETDGDLCGAAASKLLNSCTPPHADVEP